MDNKREIIKFMIIVIAMIIFNVVLAVVTFLNHVYFGLVITALAFIISVYNLVRLIKLYKGELVE